MNKTGDQDTEIEDSAGAGLMAGAGGIGKESFEIFNGAPGGERSRLSCEFHPNGSDTCWLCIKNQFDREAQNENRNR